MSKPQLYDTSYARDTTFAYYDTAIAWVHARDGTDELDRPSSTEKDSVQWTPSLNGHSTTAGTVAAPAAPHGSVWQSFITTTSPQAARASGDHVMNDSWMQRHMSNLEDPTLRQQEAEKRGKQSVAWYTSAAGRAFVWKVARVHQRPDSRFHGRASTC